MPTQKVIRCGQAPGVGWAPRTAGSTAVVSLSCPCPHLGFRVLTHRKTGRLQESPGTHIPRQGGMDVPPSGGPGVLPAPSVLCDHSAFLWGDTKERWFQGHWHFKLQHGINSMSQCACHFHSNEIALGDFSLPRTVGGGSALSVTPACTPTVQTGKLVLRRGGAGLAVLGV